MALLLLLCIFILPLLTLGNPFDSKFDALWKAYKIEYGKEYSIIEEDVRRFIWESNVRSMTRHNLEYEFGLHTFRLELNKFSDKNEKELNVYRKCLVNSGSSRDPTQHEMFIYSCGRNCSSSLPSSVDWRKKGFVSPVKDQGDCGSCWAFSSTGALEGQTKAKYGTLTQLSEQNLLDCSFKQGNAGCDGGWMEYAFQYVIENEGIDTEQAYPYTARDGHCKFRRSDVGANCTKYVKIQSDSESDLQAAVAKFGPIAVAIDASGDKFMHYSKGIYYDKTCTTTELDHAVLVVGYGSKNGTEYWIVKNSWGSTWGMDGYILMARNADNMCGIATHAVFPQI